MPYMDADLGKVDQTDRSKAYAEKSRGLGKKALRICGSKVLVNICKDHSSPDDPGFGDT